MIISWKIHRIKLFPRESWNRVVTWAEDALPWEQNVMREEERMR